ncbi:MAG: hypothetical protein ABSG68_12860 [Thermoguttaceae bacterium]|jgi:ribonuclease HII
MAYLIGTDEAGYGPNLGPLVISATLWEVPEKIGPEGLYGLLEAVICADRAQSPMRVIMADSKILYQSGKGLRLLEHGLWAAFALLGQRPARCADVWQLLAPECAAERTALFDGCDHLSVPIDLDAAELQPLAPRLREGFAAAGVRLLSVRSRAIFPRQFNEQIDRQGSKGAALSRWTMALVAELMGCLPGGPISVVCDKHGGRDHYLPLLMEHFPEVLIECHGEARQRSVYRFGPPERRVEIAFQAKAEAQLPVALASMASKYLRELAMRAFNGFWCPRVPALEATAGYPQDARRFKSQIAAVQSTLGIEDRAIWRQR